MKHLASVLLLFFLALLTLGQAPNGFNYQAVLRDVNGEIIGNDLVNVKFSIHKTSANGMLVYAETHTPTTNEFGLVNLIIGQGLVNVGLFENITWGTDVHFLQVEIDPGGGFVDMGTQQLMSVPYALSAQDATNSWSMNGNAGTDTTENFIGTTDDVSLIFKINNEPVGKIDRAYTNVFLGYNAGKIITYGAYTGYANIGLGAYALVENGTGVGNVGIGQSALRKGGYSNLAVGNSALRENNSSYNSAFGHGALNENTSGEYNTALGYYTLGNNYAGSRATAVGSLAMYNANNTSSGYINRNVAVGYESLYGSFDPANNTGNGNLAAGYQAMNNNSTGESNVALGDQTLYENTTGAWNTSCGAITLKQNLSGTYNSAFGHNALFNNSTGDANVAIGVSALRTNVAGNNATAIGTNAMYYANSSSAGFTNYNIAVGYEALRGTTTTSNNTGNYNTAIGYTSMRLNGSGENNTGCGYLTLNENSTGSSNAAFGYAALYDNTTGEGNSAFGRSAYFDVPTLSNTTCIGRSAGGVVDASNRVEIGNTSVSVIAGQVSWSTYSDSRIKDNVKEDVPGLEFITRLRPVTYNLNIHLENKMVYANNEKDQDEWEGKYDIEKIKMTGFLAQEVEQAAKESGYDFSGVQIPDNPNDLYSLRYSDFVMPLVKAVQEQQQQIAVLKLENADFTELLTEVELLRIEIELLKEQLKSTTKN